MTSTTEMSYMVEIREISLHPSSLNLGKYIRKNFGILGAVLLY